MKILFKALLFILFLFVQNSTFGQNFRYNLHINSSYNVLVNKREHMKLIPHKFDGFNYRAGVGVGYYFKIPLYVELSFISNFYKYQKTPFRRWELENGNEAFQYNHMRILGMGGELFFKYNKYKLSPFLSFSRLSEISNWTELVVYEKDEIIYEGNVGVFKTYVDEKNRMQIAAGFSYMMIDSKKIELLVEPFISFDHTLKMGRIYRYTYKADYLGVGISLKTSFKSLEKDTN